MTPRHVVRAGRGAALTTVACVLVFVPAAAAPATPRIAPQQEIVTLLAAHGVRTQPDAKAPFVASVAARRPITRTRTVLPVRAQRTDARGRRWLRVRLPGRTVTRRSPRWGWISATNTRRSSTGWHIVVDVRARRVVVHRDGRKVHSYRAIVGAAATPTPTGEHFVEENVRLPAHRVGAPFALATSARSAVIQEFDGGPGQIAVHGLQNIGGELGTAASHGCIRLSDAAITRLAAQIRPGVPLTIR